MCALAAAHLLFSTLSGGRVRTKSKGEGQPLAVWLPVLCARLLALLYPLCSHFFALLLHTQKKAQESINSRLQLVMKSGKFVLGYKETLKTLRSGKCT